MLLRRENLRHSGSVGIRRDPVLKLELLKLKESGAPLHLTGQELASKGIDLKVQGRHVLLDPGLQFLQSLHLIGREAQLLPQLKSHLDVFTKPGSDPVEPQSPATRSLLG
jgi:hypothetical protein